MDKRTLIGGAVLFAIVTGFGFYMRFSNPESVVSPSPSTSTISEVEKQRYSRSAEVASVSGNHLRLFVEKEIEIEGGTSTVRDILPVIITPTTTIAKLVPQGENSIEVSAELSEIKAGTWVIIYSPATIPDSGFVHVQKVLIADVLKD